MTYIIIACVVGVFGGFASVSKGSLFRGLAGAILLTVCLLGEIGLSVSAGFALGVWWGITTFILSWLVCGHIGAFIFRATWRSGKGDADRRKEQ